MLVLAELSVPLVKIGFEQTFIVDGKNAKMLKILSLETQAQTHKHTHTKTHTLVCDTPPLGGIVLRSDRLTSVK